MLSIAKMVARAEDYYLATVADGREEYYTGAGESPGYWLGEGARRLGLEGEVEPEDLRQVLAGVSPHGEILTAGGVAEAKRVAGFDLTFSAPKSVSLLYGLSEPGVSAIVRASTQTPSPKPRLPGAPGPASAGARRPHQRRSEGMVGRRLRPSHLEGRRPPAPHPRTGGQRALGESTAPGRPPTPASSTTMLGPPATSTRRRCAPG